MALSRTRSACLNSATDGVALTRWPRLTPRISLSLRLTPVVFVLLRLSIKTNGCRGVISASMHTRCIVAYPHRIWASWDDDDMGAIMAGIGRQFDSYIDKTFGELYTIGNRFTIKL